jgi:heat shock protein HslJ
MATHQAEECKMQMIKLAVLLVALAACSPSGDNPIAKEPATKITARSGAVSAPQLDEAKLFGTWKIVSLNGVAIKPVIADSGQDRTPRLSFYPAGFGGSSGCNSFGGQGLLRGDRYYTAPGASTAMACPDLTTQEDMISDVMRHAPRLSFGANGALTLTSKDIALVLSYDSAASPKSPRLTDKQPQFILAGTTWQIYQIDGGFLTPRSQREARPLTFEADTWSFKAACATQSGEWEQRGQAIYDKGEIAATKPPCSAPDAAIDAVVSGIMRSSPVFVTGAFRGDHSELLIGGDGHWLAATRNPEILDQASLVSGNWRVAAIDGATPIASTNPTLSFGEAIYTGSTGCNAISGAFLAQARRLFTLELPQTEMGCGPLTQQEQRITRLLAASPRIARLNSGRLALIDEKGQLELERDSSNQTRGNQALIASKAARNLDATRRKIEALQLDGENVPMNALGAAATMMFTDKRWTTNVGCGNLAGDWVAREGRIDLYTSSSPDTPAVCPAVQQIWTDKMTMIMNGPSRIHITDNGEFLLASQDHWITGRMAPKRALN